MSDAADLIEIIRRVGGDPLDLPFWEGCRAGQFLLHRCDVCQRHYWPASRCVEHGAQSMRWVAASGVGKLYTYTVMHHAYTPAMKSKVPYAVGVVRLAEGPFMHGLILGCAVNALAIDMPLRVVKHPHESGLVLPMLEPEGA